MKALNRLSKCLVALGMTLAVALVSNSALAQEAPDALVRRISLEVLDAAKTDKSLQSRNIGRVRELVESKILPYTDFQKTTAMVAGRFWREATPEQKTRLTEEFRNLLIHTYSGALSQVKDLQLEFSPLRADPADTDVEVRSRVVQPGREPIQMNYRLEKTADGWKIYDVNVLGAWLIETYKNTFAAEVNRGGIDGLIRTLAEKNRRLGGNAAQAQK